MVASSSSKSPTLPKQFILPEEEMGIDSISLASLGAYMLYDEVDNETSRDLCEFLIKANYLFDKKQVLTILVNSPGGQMYDGFAIIDLMDTSRLKIKTVGIGMIASMASLITTAGTKGMRTMTKNSFVMTHQFSTYFEGKYHEVIATRKHDDDLHTRCIEHFLRHTKMTEKQIKDVILGSSDKWLTAKEALKYGMCDKIEDPWTK
jgi:ATP-dependent Clp protease protease subunit